MPLRFFRRVRIAPGLRVNLQQERRERFDRPPWGLVHHRTPRTAHDSGRAWNWPILD